MEQIDEDLYEDFCERKKEEENVILDKYEKEKRNRAAYLKAELAGTKTLPEDKKVTEVNFGKNKKKEDKKDTEPPVNKPKTKISMLLNNELYVDEETDKNKNAGKKGKGKKKKGKGQFVEFNIHDYDLDKDFPKLK